MSSVWAIVLAGGASRRFGSDKLEAAAEGRWLLERALDGLPATAGLLVVGPDRELRIEGRPITYVREDPPGGGPAAAMIAGLLAATAAPPTATAAPPTATAAPPTATAAPPIATDERYLVLPGDTPAAGQAAAALLAELDARRASRPDTDHTTNADTTDADTTDADTTDADPGCAVVAVGTDGREQPLQLALDRRAAELLIIAAGADRGRDASARRLVGALGAGLHRLTVSAELHADIDTTADLAAWHRRRVPPNEP